MLTPIISTSERAAVEATASRLDLVLAHGSVYTFTSTVACWIKRGGSDVAATATAPSMYVPAGRDVLLVGNDTDGDRLSVIRAAGDGAATITQMRERPAFAGA